MKVGINRNPTKKTLGINRNPIERITGTIEDRHKTPTPNRIRDKKERKTKESHVRIKINADLKQTVDPHTVLKKSCSIKRRTNDYYRNPLRIGSARWINRTRGSRGSSP